MHDTIKALLLVLTKHDDAQEQDAGSEKYGYQANIKMPNDYHTRISAYRLAKFLEKNGLLQGEAQQVTYADLSPEAKEVTLGENARISVDSDPRTATLKLFFPDKTPQEISKAASHLYAEQEIRDSAPSELATTTDGFQALAKASGMRVKSVKAQDRDIIINTGNAFPTTDMLHTFCKALNSVGIAEYTPEKAIMPEGIGSDRGMRISIPSGMDPLEVQLKLMDAHNNLLHREAFGQHSSGHSWADKVTTPSILPPVTSAYKH